MTAPDTSDTQLLPLDVLRVLGHLVDVVADTGPDHVDPAARRLAEPIYHQTHDPDDALPRSRYLDDGRPACLVARILHAAGVPIDELARLDTLPRSGIETADVGGLELTPGARWLLALAQREQDDATPWGRVLDLALRETQDHGLVDTDTDDWHELLDDAVDATLGRPHEDEHPHPDDSDHDQAHEDVDEAGGPS